MHASTTAIQAMHFISNHPHDDWLEEQEEEEEKEDRIKIIIYYKRNLRGLRPALKTTGKPDRQRRLELLHLLLLLLLLHYYKAGA